MNQEISYYFDNSWVSSLPPILWNVFKFLFNVLIRLHGKDKSLKTSKGNQIFILGNSKITGCPNVLVSNDKPIISVERLRKRLYLYADLYDRTGRLVMKIVRNKPKFNENNILEKEFKKDKIKIINQFNEPIEIIARKTGEIELVGIFYCNGKKIEANKNFLKIG